MKRRTMKRFVWYTLCLVLVVMPTLLMLRFVSDRRTLPLRHHLPGLVPGFVVRDDVISKEVGNKSRLQKSVKVSSDVAETFTTTEFVHTTVKPTSARDRLMVAVGAIATKAVSRRSPIAHHPYFHSSRSKMLHNFSHVFIKPNRSCFARGGESGLESPFLMMLVLSSYHPLAASRREAIRATYGSVTTGQQWPGGKPLVAPVRMVFLLGSPPKKKVKDLIETESAQFGDILVADFVDSYENLTLKVFHGLYWVLHDCPRVKFVLKVDDDVFVNLPLLTAFLSVRGENNSVYGNVYNPSQVQRHGRWAVSDHLYPVPMYPEYASGTTYVMSMDAALKILKASNRLPLIPIEDAFITGVLTLITKVQLMRTSGFTHFLEGKPKICDFVEDSRFVGNRMSSSDKRKMWEHLRNYNRSSCL